MKIDEVALGVTATIIGHRITNLSNRGKPRKPPIGRIRNTNNITNSRRNYSNSNNRNSITNSNNINSKEAANTNRRLNNSPVPTKLLPNPVPVPVE